MTYDDGHAESAGACQPASGYTEPFGFGRSPKPPSGRTLSRSVARRVPVFLIVSVYVPLPPLSAGSCTALGSLPDGTASLLLSGLVIETSSVGRDSSAVDGCVIASRNAAFALNVYERVLPALTYVDRSTIPNESLLPSPISPRSSSPSKSSSERHAVSDVDASRSVAREARQLDVRRMSAWRLQRMCPRTRVPRALAIVR
jgi:hypothetical protein